MNNKGYSIVELLVVIIALGAFAIFAIGKLSYAFSDQEVIDKNSSVEEIISDAAKRYASDNKNIFKDTNVKYITIKDLVDNKYLIGDEEGNLKGSLNYKKDIRIKLSNKDKKVSASVES